MRNTETEELTSWFNDVNSFKETLRGYEGVGREENVKTVKEAELAYQKQKVSVTL